LPLSELTAVSSIDGRYRKHAAALSPYFSEYALMRKRLVVECEYLIALSKTPRLGVRRLSSREIGIIRAIPKISIEDAAIIKSIEREGYGDIPATNHDVKAIEYFIKLRLAKTSLKDVAERVHFALTSEDVNSVAHGFSLRSSIEEVIFPALETLEKDLEKLAKTHKKTAMLARTHGQAASPTTFGKEMQVFLSRMRRQVVDLKVRPVLVKWGGATGNYNAHTTAAPQVDWRRFARRFIDGLNVEGNGKKHFVRIELNEVTTQIEPHDTYAEMFDSMRRINTILIDFSQDMWRYISDGWIAQKTKAGEVGSSAMPHKVNPIDFENAEGNLGVANALFEHFSRKLPVSRLQRDLSDSTVERVFGTAFAHSLIGYTSLMRGLAKIEINTSAMLAELRAHPEVLAEAIQTTLRTEGIPVPYEKLRDLTRGRKVTVNDFARFIDSLDIDAIVKKRLKKLRPETYTGIAEKFVE
jgi:adenylosuccinate lyase